jgi:hypothetical protein
MRSLLLGVCLLSVTACLGTSPASPTPIDREVVLAPGQTAAIASGLTIRFQGVLGDSRCPADAMCVLGGNATVRLDILADGTTIERELHTGNDVPVSYEGVTIALVALAPYPFSARTIDPSDYRATLHVTR